VARNLGAVALRGRDGAGRESKLHRTAQMQILRQDPVRRGGIWFPGPSARQKKIIVSGGLVTPYIGDRRGAQTNDRTSNPEVELSLIEVETATAPELALTSGQYRCQAGVSMLNPGGVSVERGGSTRLGEGHGSERGGESNAAKVLKGPVSRKNA